MKLVGRAKGMELVCVEREEGSGRGGVGWSDVSSAGASVAFSTPWLVKWLCVKKQSIFLESMSLLCRVVS